MTKTFICDKIIRDNDPTLLESRGITVETRMLREEEVIVYLKKKMTEEIAEVCLAKTPEEILNELVDVYEAGRALCYALNISEDHFWTAYEEKKERKGEFKKKICLCTVTLPEDHPEISHYLSRPQKYPEK